MLIKPPPPPSEEPTAIVTPNHDTDPAIKYGGPFLSHTTSAAPTPSGDDGGLPDPFSRPVCGPHPEADGHG
ncbi:hypothetical protein MY4824_002652 [Beauveria thailandica]